jgi:hypothetical protein
MGYEYLLFCLYTSGYVALVYMSQKYDFSYMFYKREMAWVYMQYSTTSDWFNFVLTYIGIWASFSNCMHREIWHKYRVLSDLFHLVTEYTYASISYYVASFGIVFWIVHVVV